MARSRGTFYRVDWDKLEIFVAIFVMTGWQWIAILFGKSPHNCPVPQGSPLRRSARRLFAASPVGMIAAILCHYHWSDPLRKDICLFRLGIAHTIISPVISPGESPCSPQHGDILTTFSPQKLDQCHISHLSTWSTLHHLICPLIPYFILATQLAVLGKGHSYGHIPWNSPFNHHYILIENQTH